MTNVAYSALSAASTRVDRAVRGVANLVKLETVVATLCVFTPALVVLGDGGALRGSISAYYSIEEAQYFYVPLTVAAMLFIVNGVVKEQHWYNVWLGLALASLTFFNHQAHDVIHNISAVAFFLGNALVFVVFSPKKELWFKWALVAVMLFVLAGHFIWRWYSLYWAESFSLWIIAAHFILEARGLIK